MRGGCKLPAARGPGRGAKLVLRGPMVASETRSLRASCIPSPHTHSVSYSVLRSVCQHAVDCRFPNYIYVVIAVFKHVEYRLEIIRTYSEAVCILTLQWPVMIIVTLWLHNTRDTCVRVPGALPNVTMVTPVCRATANSTFCALRGVRSRQKMFLMNVLWSAESSQIWSRVVDWGVWRCNSRVKRVVISPCRGAVRACSALCRALSYRRL